MLARVFMGFLLEVRRSGGRIEPRNEADSGDQDSRGGARRPRHVERAADQLQSWAAVMSPGSSVAPKPNSPMISARRPLSFRSASTSLNASRKSLSAGRKAAAP